MVMQPIICSVSFYDTLSGWFCLLFPFRDLEATLWWALALRFFRPSSFFWARSSTSLGIRHFCCLHSIKAVIPLTFYPYFPFHISMLRDIRPDRNKISVHRETTLIFLRSIPAFHAFHICYILIFKDIFPGVKFSGHILGVFRKMQPVFLSLIPGKSVIIHRLHRFQTSPCPEPKGCGRYNRHRPAPCEKASSSSIP